MDFFDYRRGILHCEGVPLGAVAERLGTPTYVYSLGTVLHHLRRLAEAFRGVDHQIYYSVKANSNVGLMAALAREGCGFDVFSGGELFRVKKAGAAMDKVVFAGVGKTEAEMTLGVRSRIQMFNIESWPEAVRLDAIARRLGRRVRGRLPGQPRRRRAHPRPHHDGHGRDQVRRPAGRGGRDVRPRPARAQERRAVRCPPAHRLADHRDRALPRGPAQDAEPGRGAARSGAPDPDAQPGRRPRHHLPQGADEHGPAVRQGRSRRCCAGTA